MGGCVGGGEEGDGERMGEGGKRGGEGGRGGGGGGGWTRETASSPD